MKISAHAQVNNVNAIYRLALDSEGVVHLNEFICAAALRDGLLVPLMPAYPCADGSQMLVLYPHERSRLPRVAAMLDFLEQTFAGRPWRQPVAIKRRQSIP